MSRLFIDTTYAIPLAGLVGMRNRVSALES
jgi:hypothetical protein